DVNAVRMLLAVIDRPEWRDDIPRLVTGALQRHQFGHWSTTVSNAWGTLAMDAFSRRFEREAVTGSTRASFEGQRTTQSFDWSRIGTGGALAMGWPAGAGIGPLSVKQEGSGKPWLTLTSRAAVPLSAPLLSGYRISKTITPIEQKTKDAYSRGDV